ncbi:MAG: Fic/DOC family N-terminal domain-containing protein [Chloroflexia bacterium]
MNLDRFKSHRSGRLAEIWHEDKRRLAFVPKSLPPTLEIDTELISALSDADRALGELAGVGHSIAIPNSHLLVGPFIRREAVLSSRIEGTRTNIDELYSYEARQLSLSGAESNISEPDAHEVSNYVRALEHGLKKQQTTQINLELLREIHAILMNAVHQGRANPGEFRTVQNWISSGGRGISAATFVPPPVKEMQQALQDLEAYIQGSNGLPPLIRLALIHYQFEAIHPFIDGNGRVGRLLISLLLVNWHLLPSPLLYLSAFIERHRSRYYELLLAVTEQGRWEEWVLFFIQGVKEEAKDASNRLRLLQNLKLEWDKKLQKSGISELTWRLAEDIFVTPKVTIPLVQRKLGVSDYKTAQRAVERLVSLGILRAVDDNKYGKQFVANEIMDIISD